MLWPVDDDVKTRFAAGAAGDPVQLAGCEAFVAFRLRRLARTRSTQDVVRGAARAGAAEGWCCVAAEQTAGRGRQGRSWTAPPGAALLMSVLLRPDAAVAGGVPLACGVAVADAVDTATGVQVGLKWPNDVLAPGGGKLAGVLVEVEPLAPEHPDGGVAAVAGIGLNLSVDAFPPGVVGASLHRLAGRQLAADDVLAALLHALGRRMAELRDGGVAQTVRAWRQRAVGLGERVEVVTSAGVVTGTAVDVADDGALLIAPDDEPARPTRVLAGDVHVRPRQDISPKR